MDTWDILMLTEMVEILTKIFVIVIKLFEVWILNILFKLYLKRIFFDDFIAILVPNAEVGSAFLF